MRTIIRAAAGKPIELPILFAACMGLRLSEIKALRLCDFEGNILHIRRALVAVGLEVVEKTTKTYTSSRDMIVPQFILDKLPDSDDKIAPLKHKSTYHAFIRLLNQCGLPHFRFHDLRHYYASTMLSLGIPNKYAQNQMGHSTDTTLKNIYQHIQSDKANQFIAEINEHFQTQIANEC